MVSFLISKENRTGSDTVIERSCYFIFRHQIYDRNLWICNDEHLKRVQVIENAAIQIILQLLYLTPRIHFIDDQRLKILPIKKVT